MFSLDDIQSQLIQESIDGWLLYDFRGSNQLAQRILDLPEDIAVSRRFAYSIPSAGTPKKLVHAIEADVLDHLPGEKIVYLSWQQFEVGVASLLEGMKSVAMEYAPRASNPYISRVDAGTVELVRENGVDVVSSGNLVQQFEATLDEEQWQSHLAANAQTTKAFEMAWSFIANEVRTHGQTDELAVRKVIADHFEAEKMTTYHLPIVAVGPNSGLPHYETGTGSNTIIREGDFVLIDQWAKMDKPRAVYSDLTRVGYVDTEVPEKFEKIFQVVAAGRDAALKTVQSAFANGEELQGWQVDRAARDEITKAGYGEFFAHRTGHNMGQETHGNGAHMDDIETHEERRLLKNTLFTIEPGVYLKEFGVRSEIDVFIDSAGEVRVTGGPIQTEVVPILARY